MPGAEVGQGKGGRLLPTCYLYYFVSGGAKTGRRRFHAQPTIYLISFYIFYLPVKNIIIVAECHN